VPSPKAYDPAMRVAVVGAGSWGTTFASLVASKAPTTLWARRAELAEAIDRTHTNPDYLPGIELDPSLRASADLGEVLRPADVVVMAVPSHGYRAVLEAGAPHVRPETPVVSLTKGIEAGTLLRMTQVTAEVLPGHDRSIIGVVSGPNLAREIALGQPAATVLALGDEPTARELQALFMTPRFRVYTNPDVVGAETAGAAKNVMAIAAGMASGMGFGDNTRATLITRALAEITRLGVAMGGDPRTFSGLAGVGDLIATCSSVESRNHRVGRALGEGRSLEEVVAEMRMVAEGVKSTAGILALAERHGVDMPIARQVGRVLYEGASVREALEALMGRPARSEVELLEARA